MKINKAFLLVLVHSLLILLTFNSFAQSQPTDNPLPASAMKVFRLSMQDENLSGAYREVLIRKAGFEPDYEMLRYLRYGHPFLARLFVELENINSQMITDFSMYARANMTRIKPGITSQYNRYYSMSRQNGLELGLSEKALANLELYVAGGGLNAYTVSADANRIIVVMQSEMFEKLTQNEIRAVSGHEYAHNLFSHSIQRQMINFLLNVVGHTVTTPNIPELQNQTNAQFLTEASTLNKDFFTGLTAHNDTGATVSAISAGIVAEGNKVMMQAFHAMMALPESERMMILNQFLMRLLNTMSMINANPGAIEYMTNILGSLSFDKRVALSPIEYKYRATEAYLAASRSHEFSCDLVAGTLVANKALASSFGKLSGLDFKSSDRENALRHWQEQAREFLSSHTAEEIAAHVGKSHTAAILRVNDTLNIPRYPYMSFANPFMRNLIVDTAAEEFEKHLRTLALGFEKNQMIEEEKPHANESLFEQWAHKIASPFVKKTKAKNPFQEQIETIQASRRTHQFNLLKLVEEIGLETPLNPRFNNTLEYYSMEREILLEQLNFSLAASENKSETNEQLRAYYKQEAAAIDMQLDLEPQFLLLLKSSIENKLAADKLLSPAARAKLQDRLKLIQLTLKSNDIETLRSVRNKLISEPENLKDSFLGRVRVPDQNPYLAARCADLLEPKK